MVPGSSGRWARGSRGPAVLRLAAVHGPVFLGLTLVLLLLLVCPAVADRQEDSHNQLKSHSLTTPSTASATEASATDPGAVSSDDNDGERRARKLDGEVEEGDGEGGSRAGAGSALHGAPVASGTRPAASSEPLASFPSAQEATILFLHVFKCAGSTLREVLMMWTKNEGWTGAFVEGCEPTDQSTEHKICVVNGTFLKDSTREKWLVNGQKLLAGRFFWDFRMYVPPPYLMTTILRNPLELFVSTQQSLHPGSTLTFEGASQFVADSMDSRLRRSFPTDIGFVRRFVDADAYNEYKFGSGSLEQKQADLVATAVNNLSTFWVVGVLEQYHGYIEVLKRMLDPNAEHPLLWKAGHHMQNKRSPVHSGTVLSNIDSNLVREFNTSALHLQWQVYDAALELWDSRCREVMPLRDEKIACRLPPRRIY